MHFRAERKGNVGEVGLWFPNSCDGVEIGASCCDKGDDIARELGFSPIKRGPPCPVTRCLEGSEHAHACLRFPLSPHFPIMLQLLAPVMPHLT